jgi:hypothetical protein
VALAGYNKNMWAIFDNSARTLNRIDLAKFLSLFRTSAGLG